MLASKLYRDKEFVKTSGLYGAEANDHAISGERAAARNSWQPSPEFFTGTPRVSVCPIDVGRTVPR